MWTETRCSGEEAVQAQYQFWHPTSAMTPAPGLWPLSGCAWPSDRPALSSSKPCRQPDTCRQHLNCPVRQLGCGAPSVGRHGLNFKELCNVYSSARSDRIILVSFGEEAWRGS